MTLKIYEVREESRDNPDNSPGRPPEKGMWVWWRTGPHPEGVWQAMEASGGEWAEAYAANERLHKPFQDRALGAGSDWGYMGCHACGEMSEGYQEPRHRTVCDGVCKLVGCRMHPTPDEERRKLPKKIQKLERKLAEAKARLEELS